jgi:hypothetical protein
MGKIAKLLLSGLFLITAGLTGCETAGNRQPAPMTSTTTASGWNGQANVWPRGPAGATGQPVAGSTQLNGSAVQPVASTGPTSGTGSLNPTGSSGPATPASGQ